MLAGFGKMPTMKTWVWMIGLWLLGTAPVAALDVAKPEMLNFRVYWGPLRVGDAQLSYAPQGKTYSLTASMKDDSALIDLHDTWQSQGQHRGGKVFLPDSYHVVQAENDYRADKTMTFDRKAGKVIYKNNRDASDVAEPLPLEGARDVLATVYAWRVAGMTELGQAARVPVVSLKKTMTLHRSAGVRESVRLDGRDVPAWRVDMRSETNGKPGKDSWSVYVSDSPEMVPLKIVAKTKFGTFRALRK